tara:strand:+ start:253 stop:771 length:519 start_codon:yes stop_codon:yes gene_type:complete
MDKGIYIFFEVHLKKENISSTDKITIAKLYPFSDDSNSIDTQYKLINMTENREKIDGRDIVISITRGIGEVNEKIIGLAYNGNNKFKIMEKHGITEIENHLQKEKSLFNFYQYGIYDWIIFKKVEQFLTKEKIEILNQTDLHLNNSETGLQELSGKVSNIKNNVDFLSIDSK